MGHGQLSIPKGAVTAAISAGKCLDSMAQGRFDTGGAVKLDAYFELAFLGFRA